MADSSDRSLRWYSTREPAILLILTAIAVIFFLAVSLLARVYHNRQASQAEKWFRRGTYDQQKGLLDRAVGEFQAAQLYSRGNFDYQLSLAQTLTALGRTDEAYSYLLSLHEQKPESGTVNLALARIFAKKGNAATAIRYYHNALYATWPADAENQRLAGRLELIEFLLHENDEAQAQSELIAMSANLPADAALHARTGELFFRCQDYEHSLEQYLETLKLNGHDSVALKGAGQAAFELGRYSLAQRYLRAAAERNTNDSAIIDLLNTTNLVLKMDPFLRQISVSQRHQIVIDAFSTAGERLKACTLSSAAPLGSSATSQPTLDARWKELKPRITKAGLRQDPDLVDTAMNLVFAIEHVTAQCSVQSAKDHALLLISQLHESNER